MDILNSFINMLCGSFNNDEQINDELKNGKLIHMRASHINNICNDKIKNLPEGFKGYFVIEESYYELKNGTNILPHLFLFTLNEEGKVMLTSYEIPEKYSKEEFRNDNNEIAMDYNNLKISEKFNPMVYEYEEGIFKGESLSTFAPGITFLLKEHMNSEGLFVSEIFKRNDVITFGFEDPIIYKRI